MTEPTILPDGSAFAIMSSPLPKLTPEQIDEAIRLPNGSLPCGIGTTREHAVNAARAIEAARDQMWVEMLSKQEPVAYIGMIDEDHFADVCRKAGGNSSTPLYTAPQPQPKQEPVASAISAVIAAMQADPEYAWSWHCNVAMAFVDAGGDHYTANQGAARFMRLLANVEPAHDLPEAPQPAKPAEQERDGAMNALCKMFHHGEEVESDDGMAMLVPLDLWHDAIDALDSLTGEDEAAPVAPQPAKQMLTEGEIDRALDLAGVPELPAGHESVEIAIAQRDELLAALKEAVGLIEMAVPFEGSTVRKARAAIAKATGEQT